MATGLGDTDLTPASGERNGAEVDLDRVGVTGFTGRSSMSIDTEAGIATVAVLTLILGFGVGVALLELCVLLVINGFLEFWRFTKVQIVSHLFMSYSPVVSEFLQNLDRIACSALVAGPRAADFLAF